MLHDESIYPDPFAFKPERFLTEDGLSLNITTKDPGFAIWGFGRRLAPSYFITSLINFTIYRICPGRFMAASTIWITVASLIAAFDIKKSSKCGGLDHAYDPGILR
jgi:cytochrome P450